MGKVTPQPRPQSYHCLAREWLISHIPCPGFSGFPGPARPAYSGWPLSSWRGHLALTKVVELWLHTGPTQIPCISLQPVPGARPCPRLPGSCRQSCFAPNQSDKRLGLPLSLKMEGSEKTRKFQS